MLDNAESLADLIRMRQFDSSSGEVTGFKANLDDAEWVEHLATFLGVDKLQDNMAQFVKLLRAKTVHDDSPNPEARHYIRLAEGFEKNAVEFDAILTAINDEIVDRHSLRSIAYLYIRKGHCADY